ncbi:hypothetical protein HELRODRAFT_160298 [Helobdella robusta]|uniref:Uncharacterized protein n=1 Tax=Helobdella robusta TaxID=6412 RepID=T1EQ23_HELRO|nr:hypothetical protein HELRODRAFT_160298 [Helobdella robusta]ESO06149.1 hypothetical protein HELRODRAFT_160298 [Helobdella robusta]
MWVDGSVLLASFASCLGGLAVGEVYVQTGDFILKHWKFLLCCRIVCSEGKGGGVFSKIVDDWGGFHNSRKDFNVVTRHAKTHRQPSVKDGRAKTLCALVPVQTCAMKNHMKEKNKTKITRQILDNNVEILHYNDNHYNLRLAESILIQQRHPIINILQLAIGILRTNKFRNRGIIDKENT